MGEARKVLVVDDDTGTREFYRMLFEDNGYEVAALDSPTTIFSTCSRFKPDLLVLDWDTPGGGGKQAYNVVTATLGKKVPTIFCSGYPDRITVPAGPDVVIMKKPPNMDTVLEAATKLLGE